MDNTKFRGCVEYQYRDGSKIITVKPLTPFNFSNLSELLFKLGISDLSKFIYFKVHCDFNEL